MEHRTNTKDLLGRTQVTPASSGPGAPHFSNPPQQSDDELRIERLRYDALLATVSEGVLISKPCGTVTMCNDRTAQILRLSQEQIYKGEHHALCQHALQEDGTPFDLRQHPIVLAFESGCAQRAVVMGLRYPDGDVVWISVNTTPLFAEGVSSPIEVLCTISDITAKVQHKTRIQSQQRWLEEAQRIARLGSWTWAPELNRVWWSDAIYELFGVDRSTEPSYENFLSLVHPEDRPLAQERVRQMLAGESEFASDLRIIRPDQTCLWIHSRARAHRDDQGNILLVEGTDQDITDRKQSEVALRSSEQRLGIALKAACAVAFEWNIPKDLIVRHFFNTDNWPLPLDAPYSLDVLRRRIHPEDLATFDTSIRRCLEYGQGTHGDYRCQYRVIKQDGSLAWLETWGMLERSEDHKPLRLVGISMDVTEQVHANEELHRTSVLLKAVASGTTDAVFVKDLEGKYLFANESTASFLGKSPEEVVGSTDQQLFDPSSAAIICEIDRSIVESSKVTTIEETLTANGQTRTYLATKGPFLGPQGEVVGVVGISRDITKRRQTERLMDTQHAVVRTLAEANDLLDAAENLLEAIGSSCSWQHGEFWLFEPETPQKLKLMCQWSQGADSRKLSCCPTATETNCILHRVCESRRTEWLVELDPATTTLCGSRTGKLSPNALYSCVAIPITFDNSVQGVLAFLSEGRRERDDRLIDVLENLSLQIGQFIERKRTEARVRLFRVLLDRANDIIEVCDLESGRIIDVNARGCEAHGYTRDEYLDLSLRDTSPLFADKQNWSSNLSQLREKGNLTFESQFRRKDGIYVPVEISINLIALEKEYLVAVIRDITDRKLTEQRMRMSQKMEAIGQLAGGIAHDFNNLLTVINCHAQLLLDITPAQDSLHEHFFAIQHAGNRAAELTSQLLTFSRRRVSEARPIDLNGIIRLSAKMLSRVLREDITLQLNLAPQLDKILADSVQIERIVLNLAVNARDAMSEGGYLRLSTNNFVIDEQNIAQFPELMPGKYVVFEVADSGRGMPDEIRPRIFEPFFTTKDIGAGTGLGLAVVHGIVQQYDGQIFVDSRLGEGTTFRILLPATGHVQETGSVESSNGDQAFTATVLVVDDEQSVLSVVRSVLEPKGIRVLSAHNGQQALDLLKSEAADQVDILLTDVVMPSMKGHELAANVRALYPKIRTIFMSGYPIGFESSTEPDDVILGKPFTPAQLFNAICEQIAKSSSR